MAQQRTSESPRGWPLKVRQRLRGGSLVTIISTQVPGGQIVETGYRGPLTASGLAHLLRTMAHRVSKAAPEII